MLLPLSCARERPLQNNNNNNNNETAAKNVTTELSSFEREIK